MKCVTGVRMGNKIKEKSVFPRTGHVQFNGVQADSVWNPCACCSRDNHWPITDRFLHESITLAPTFSWGGGDFYGIARKSIETNTAVHLVDNVILMCADKISHAFHIYINCSWFFLQIKLLPWLVLLLNLPFLVCLPLFFQFLDLRRKQIFWTQGRRQIDSSIF